MAQYPSHPSRFQIRTLWSAATGVSILVLGTLLVGLIWLLGHVLGFLQPVVVPLAVAGIIAYLLDPLVRRFQKHGLSRSRSVIMVFASFTLLAAVLTAIMIPLVGNQLNEFREQRKQTLSLYLSDEDAAPRKPFDEAVIDVLINERNRHPWTKSAIDSLISAPEDAGPNALRGDKLTETLNAAAEDHATAVPSISLGDTLLWQQIKSLQDEAINWIRGSTSKILGFIALVIGSIMVPIYLYYFLSESASIKEHWHEYIPLKASPFRTEVIETLTEINGYMISFFRGQVLVAFIDGILIGVALSIFGLPLGLPIGIMMAIVGIIPFVGNIITLIPACLIAYFHYSVPANQGWLGGNPWAYVGAVCAIFFIAQQINSLVTAPKIVGDSVGLHPMTVIFSMIFWSLILGGFVGALLAVPLTASVKVLFRRYIWERKLKDGPGDPEAMVPARASP